jgi:hypothetical protein
MAETGMPSSSATRLAESTSAMRSTFRRSAARAPRLCSAASPMNLFPGAPRRSAASCLPIALFAEPGRFFRMDES